MKIIILNGSPKGKISVTMQYIDYIKKMFPGQELTVLDICRRIKAIEDDDQIFGNIIAEIKSADGIIWAFPLYFLLVHSDYKRFIELISIKNARDAFKNKYTVALSTSIHYYDHTAHNYINAICDDLEMNYIGSFSAGMYDLLAEKERSRLAIFARYFFQAIQYQIPTPRNFQAVISSDFNYLPGPAGEKVNLDGKRVLIIADMDDSGGNLGRMIDRFARSFSGPVEIADLNNLDMKGSCLGCIRCGYNNQCIYTGKDGYIDFYNNRLKPADILVLAGTIKDRYLSSLWKRYFDRSFFNGHAPSLQGKQFGFIISGPLRQNPNLRQILEAQVQMQHSNCVGVVTDEYEDSGKIDNLLESLARRLIQSSKDHYSAPSTFLGIGGRKIFRDEIWGNLRFPFRADHRAYKKSGVYDFPQKRYYVRFRNALMLLLSKIPRFRREINKRMKEEMIKPLQKVIKIYYAY